MFPLEGWEETQATCGPPVFLSLTVPLAPWELETEDLFSQGFVVYAISVSIATGLLAGPSLAPGQN